MIRSMTAFAQVKGSRREKRWSVEIRSLNHRYFEFSAKISQTLAPLEGRIRDLAQARLRRGKVTVAVWQDSGAEPSAGLRLHEENVRFYLSSIRSLKKKFRLDGEISVQDLLHLPGLFSVKPAEETDEKAWPELKKVLGRALDKAVQAKEIEGGKLARDISARLDRIESAVGAIEGVSQGQEERIFKRLSERVQKLLENGAVDRDRMLREVAFLAEKCDITEEIVRMKSHLELFRRRLQGHEEMGRELDFLCQEMHREINTMGSKSELFDIATQVVQVKGELEKIREQVQNIE